MALFKVSKGNSTNLPNLTSSGDGYSWFTFDDGKFYIDYIDPADVVLKRKAINAVNADYAGTAVRALIATTAVNATKIGQAASTTTSANYRVILSTSGVDTAETGTVNKSSNLQYNPSTNQLSTGNVKLTGELDVTGDTYLRNQTYTNSLTSGSLLVNGNANFVQSPTAPTPASSSNDTTVATTAFVKNAQVASSITALYAVTALRALSAGSAGYAASAAQATHAASSDYAQTASYAVTALRAISAASAGYATSAAQATYASQLSTTGTTGQFWRGDNTWSDTLVGDLNVSGNVTLSGETIADSLTAGNLQVNGAANFVNSPTAPTPASTSNDTTVATTAFVKNAQAGSAITALYAVTALRAISAGSAGYAASAAQATYAASANYAQAALTSSYAVTALRAISSASANYAASAAQATHAASADYAQSALTASYAVTSARALSALTADNAVKAQKDASGNVITSTYAPLASPTFTGIPAAPTAAAGTNTTQLATTAFVQTAVSQGFAANDAMVFKGTLGATNGTVLALPTSGYSAGWTYRVVDAGVYAGEYCEVGDLVIAVKDFNTATADTDWTKVEHNIDGALYKTSSISYTGNKVLLSSGTSGAVKEGTVTTENVIKTIAWNAGAVTSTTVSNGVIRMTIGTIPSLTTTAQSVIIGIV